MMFSNLLPQDTRIAELVSCIAMLVVSLSLFSGGGITGSMVQLHPPQFWGAMLGAFGLLQMISLLLHPKVETLRVVTAMCNGAWWVWLSLTSMAAGQTPSDFGSLFLGIANLYGAMIGFLFLRQKWVS